MFRILKRRIFIFASILAVQVFDSSFAVAYAQSPGAETESKKTAYITLDDGPSRSITAINLDTLKSME